MSPQESESTGDNESRSSERANSESQETERVQDVSRPFLQTDDCWAIILGMLLLIAALSCEMMKPPPSTEIAVSSAQQTQQNGEERSSKDGVANGPKKTAADKEPAAPVSALKRFVAKPGKWQRNPLHSLGIGGGEPGTLFGVFGMFVICALSFGLATVAMKKSFSSFLPAFATLFLLGVLAYVLAGQSTVHYFGLSYALWALLVGLAISNTIGVSSFLKPAIKTELYIKTGLVIMGAEILISKLVVLGVPGVFVAWVVTPIVLVSTFWFGQKILRIKSPSLNMVICADMCVCGVSAAIATSAACKAKKEELSAAIGLSLMFTAIMMVVMPLFVKAVGMGPVLGGAWIGGTIDATGAVALAGETLGEDAKTIATTVKMIQNILIGVIAFAVSVYWVKYQEHGEGRSVGVSEIWKRFPKFVLGFVAASALFSVFYAYAPSGAEIITATTKGVTKNIRGWFFCLAFVSIGLETNFREIAKQFHGGRPLILYLSGQTLNLILTLGIAWLMFEKLFPAAVAEALK